MSARYSTKDYQPDDITCQVCRKSVSMMINQQEIMNKQQLKTYILDDYKEVLTAEQLSQLQDQMIINITQRLDCLCEFQSDGADQQVKQAIDILKNEYQQILKGQWISANKH